VSSDIRDVPPRTGILMGTAFLAAGLPVVGIGLDWVHVSPSAVHAPGWVLVVCGGIFALPGAAMLYYAFANLAGYGGRGEGQGAPLFMQLVGLTMAAGMAAVFGWVAFGPGERRFSGSGGIGPVHVGGSSTGTSGRLAFGIATVLIGAVAAWRIVAALRGRSKPPTRRDRRDEGP